MYSIDTSAMTWDQLADLVQQLENNLIARAIGENGRGAIGKQDVEALKAAGWPVEKVQMAMLCRVLLQRSSGLVALSHSLAVTFKLPAAATNLVALQELCLWAAKLAAEAGAVLQPSEQAAHDLGLEAMQGLVAEARRIAATVGEG